MEMARRKIARTNVIVASDIDRDDVRNSFREFMLDKLSGEARTESVYEFDYENCGVKWNRIVETIGEIIDNRSDTVYLWDVDKPEGESNYELYRTKIGK